MSAPEPTPENIKLPSPPVEQTVEDADKSESPLEQALAATEEARDRPPAVEKPVGFHPAEISALINSDVVARYVDDAPFLWQLRDRAVTAPHYALHDLAELDERVEAQLDGLRVAGDFGWNQVERALQMATRGEVFTAGVLALESRNPRRCVKVLKTVIKDSELQRALISAVGWVPFEATEMVLRQWIRSDNAGLRRVALGGFAVHRRDPGAPLLHCLCDVHSVVRAHALKATGELRRTDLMPMIQNALNDKKRNCRYQAAWAAALFGDCSLPVIETLRTTALHKGRYQERALDLAIRCLPHGEALEWLRSLWKNPRRLRLAAIGAGALGDPALVGVLIELMEIESVARVAGEAFSRITGADLKYLDLNRDAPQHDPADEAYWSSVHETLGADDDLPWPAPQLVATWWHANQDRFQPGQRYLCGGPINRENLREVLQLGKQRQRAAAALQLALLEPGQPLFEVRARGGWQERRLRA